MANAFNQFTNEPLYVVGKSKKADRQNARIYIATYPGMMKIMDHFDVGYFDLIIADESQRVKNHSAKQSKAKDAAQ